MGFKRVLLNRITDDNNKTLISEMDDNNDGNNDANRKHTDFSIDKILSDDSARGTPSLSPENLYRHISNEYYAYWNRRIYPPITSLQQHNHRSAFLPTASSTVTSNSAHYEIMNLSLRMYDQQITHAVDRIRSAYAWCNPSTSHTSKQYESQLSLNSNNNNNSSVQNNNTTNNLSANDNSTSATAYGNSKYALYQNLKTYDIIRHNFSNLSELNVNVDAMASIKSEPLAPETGGATNLACSVCNKVFENPLILDAHERTHKSPRYKCDECGKGFSQLRNYKYHVSVHKGTKEFAAKCPECGKFYINFLFNNRNSEIL